MMSFWKCVGLLRSAAITSAFVVLTANMAFAQAAGGKLAWAVLAPTVGPPAGANVLVGGSNRSVALQPVSVEGIAGLDIQLAGSGLELTLAP